MNQQGQTVNTALYLFHWNNLLWCWQDDKNIQTDFRIKASLGRLLTLSTCTSSVLKPRVEIILTKNFFVSDGNINIHGDKINSRLKARRHQLTRHSKTGESCKLEEKEKMAWRKNLIGRSGEVESYQASINFSFSLVPWAKATVSLPPTKFLKALNRVNFRRMGNQVVSCNFKKITI